MDAHVKADLHAFLSEERRSREERSDRIVRMQKFVENFQESMRNVIEPAMQEFIAELEGDLGLPTCAIHALPQQVVPTIRFDFQVNPVGLHGYNGEPLPCPSFTLRANEDELKIEFEGEPGSTGSVEPEEVTAAWIQKKLLARLKEVVAAGRSNG